jgi:hypothetical protein
VATSGFQVVTAALVFLPVATSGISMYLSPNQLKAKLQRFRFVSNQSSFSISKPYFRGRRKRLNVSRNTYQSKEATWEFPRWKHLATDHSTLITDHITCQTYG